MAKKELSPRRLKGYYKFSKKYPSRNAESYAIGESRKMKKKEKARKIVFAVLLCCLFVATFILISVSMTLSNRPLTNNMENETLISVDNLGTIRATYIENTVLGEITDLSKELKKAKKNGCNAVMLDFKTQEGYVTIDGKSDKYYSIDNVIIEKIKAEGFIIVARIFCFEDSYAPQRLGAFVYENQEKTKIWFDAPAINGGRVWLDPTNQRATNYICTVIGAAVNMGADCVYLQSVEFPQARDGAPVFFSQDNATLNRNLVLMQFIEKAVNTVFPEYKPVPYIMNGATDSRYFTRVCDNCLRFVPFKIDNQQYGSVHGIDENVDIDTLAPAVDFYKYVIKEV